MGNGVGGLGTPRTPSETSLPIRDARVSEAAAKSAQELAETFWNAPYHRPLSAANIVVSAMLIIGSFLLIARRRGAPWWIVQAAIANILWTLAETGTQVVQLYRSLPKLAQVIDREIQARLATQSPGSSRQQPFDGADAVWVYLAFVVAYGLLRQVIYLWFMYRARSAEVTEWISSEPQ